MDSTAIENFVGLRENYYAFEWGDALFVVLDPYWHTTTKPGKSSDNWDWTLGEQQYHWFRQTLENSDATFKFVFCHQLVGGKDAEGRGGSEYASYYEQGGLNEDGSWGFNEKRPNWDKPIHQLMAENNVTIFFHGHDHFFAKQDLDGVVYQLVPQPSHPNYEKAGQASKYGYITGDILPPSGHLRVSVSKSTVTVDYVRAYQLADENPAAGRVNGKVDYSYTVHAQNTSAPVSNPPKNLPQKFQLHQNSPNPFNPETKINYQIPNAYHVTLKLYNLLGQEVNILVDQVQIAGNYTVRWDGKDQQGTLLASGIFIYRCEAGSFIASKKLALIR